jgi:hypothetical protein
MAERRDDRSRGSHFSEGIFVLMGKSEKNEDFLHQLLPSLAFSTLRLESRMKTRLQATGTASRPEPPWMGGELPFLFNRNE